MHFRFFNSRLKKIKDLLPGGLVGILTNLRWIMNEITYWYRFYRLIKDIFAARNDSIGIQWGRH